MEHTYSAGAVMVGPDNKIAVVSQHGTSWSLTKGTLEKGEDDMTTLKRELKEEAGIMNFQIKKRLGTYERYLIGKDGGEDTSHLKTITFYLCTTDQSELKPEDPENPEALWVEINKVAGLLTHPKDKKFYLDHLDEIKELINSRER
jgi:8-oxo-dGTP pyrophosphatase MutT (NUDIX family)